MSLQDQFSFFPPPPMIQAPPRYTEAEARALFDEWWKNHCWLKRGVEGARKAYIRAVCKGRATPKELAEGADRYAEHLRRNPTRYVKWPQGWINDGRHSDDLSADDRGSAERARSSAHAGAARLFSNRGGLR